MERVLVEGWRRLGEEVRIQELGRIVEEEREEWEEKGEIRIPEGKARYDREKDEQKHQIKELNDLVAQREAEQERDRRRKKRLDEELKDLKGQLEVRHV